MAVIEIKDITGLSKPLTRLIEVVAKGVGRVTHAYFLRRDADARVYEIDAIADAVARSAQRHGVPVVYRDGRVEAWRTPEDGAFSTDVRAISERAASRVEYQERQRQENVERITSGAAEQLSTESEVPAKPPDDDWITRFFAGAQDVSQEEMQRVWARILAGEIARPGTYSLRALDCVRNITKSEANALESAGRFALVAGRQSLIAVPGWIVQNRDSLLEQHIIVLAEAGILYPSALSLTLPKCQRRSNSGPPSVLIAEVKVTHPS